MIFWILCRSCKYRTVLKDPWLTLVHALTAMLTLRTPHNLYRVISSSCTVWTLSTCSSVTLSLTQSSLTITLLVTLFYHSTRMMRRRSVMTHTFLHFLWGPVGVYIFVPYLQKSTYLKSHWPMAHFSVFLKLVNSFINMQFFQNQLALVPDCHSPSES